MEYDIIVPKFDEEGTVVTVAKWYKKVGDYINKDDILADVESSIVNCEITSPVSGILSVIYIPEGRQTRLGTQIASIEEDSFKQSEVVTEANSYLDSRNISNVNKEIKEEARKLDAEMAEEALKKRKLQRELNNEEIKYQKAKIEKDELKLDEEIAKEAFENAELNMMNKAKKLAAVIVKNRPETDADTWNKINKITTPNDSSKAIDFITLKVAEQRLLSSQKSVISTVINEVDMSDIISLINKFGQEFETKYKIRLGFTPLIIKSVIAALKDYPMFNAFVRDDEIIYKKNFDISLGTQGIDSSIFPVIRDVDKKSIAQIENEMIILSEKCEKHELTLEETSGGTFMLINSGIYGSLLGSDVITYPNIASLSMHKVTDRPVANNGHVSVRSMMYISLSFDNRLANTRDASLFLNRIKMFAENTGSMILGL